MRVLKEDREAFCIFDISTIYVITYRVSFIVFVFKEDVFDHIFMPCRNDEIESIWIALF